METQADRCFACDKPLGRNPKTADTRDDQIVFVGSDCHKRIEAAGKVGYQPPKGGPRLFPVAPARTSYEVVGGGVNNNGWWVYNVKNLLTGRMSEKSKQAVARLRR